MGSALGAGRGADMLQQVLRQKFAESIQQQAMQQSQERIGLERDRMAQQAAMQAEQLKSLQEARDASAKAQATTKALRIASALRPGAHVGADTMGALQAGDMGDLVQHRDATIGSRNLGGSLSNLTSTANPGQAEADIYTGTADQLQAQEDRKAREALAAQTRQDRIDAREDAQKAAVEMQRQRAADQQTLTRIAAEGRNANADLNRQLLQGRVDDQRAKADEKTRAAGLARSAAMASIDDTSSALDELIDANGQLKPGVAGAFGWDSIRSSVPGTKPADAKARLDRLVSRLTVDLMGEMKSQSRTGATGFGALNESELKTIQNAAARLSQSQSDESARQALLDVRKHLAGMRSRAAGGAPPAAPPAAGGGGFRVVEIK